VTRPAPLSYGIITPARDERSNLERLARSVLAQSHRPTTWIVADDGSTDGTEVLAAELSAEHPWIEALPAAAKAAGEVSEGRREGRALVTFRSGVRAIRFPVGVVVKVDADTSFDADYFRELMTRFAEQPDLGIAGGACWEFEDGEWVRRKVTPTHPRGASRAYRWECLNAVMELEPRMGWDGLDEIKVALQGYRSVAFTDIGFCHHRKVGARERARLRNGTAMGRAAWHMGYRPSYLLLRTLYRAWREPSAIGMPAGFLAAAIQRSPRHSDPAVLARIRDEQRLRVVLRRGRLP